MNETDEHNIDGEEPRSSIAQSKPAEVHVASAAASAVLSSPEPREEFVPPGEADAERHSSRDSRRLRIIAAAEAYRARGWPVVRLAGKAAVDTGWSKATSASPIPKFDDTNNVGILLGEPAGGLVRPDFEWPARNVAEALFAEEFPRFGRLSAPGTGLLVISAAAKSKQYALPESVKEDSRLPVGHKDSLLVCELLSTGKQTMAAPSVHPDSGEEVEWEHYPDNVPELPPAELDRRMGLYAFLAAVSRFWTGDEHGFWFERGLALAAVLLDVFADLSEEGRIGSVDTLVKATARDGGDTDWHKRTYAGTTLEKVKAGLPATGLPKLIELLGLPNIVADTFRKWIGIQARAKHPVCGASSAPWHR